MNPSRLFGRVTRVLPLAVAVLVSGGAYSCADHRDGAAPPSEVRKFIGDDAVAILSNPEKVESLRLSSRRGATTPAATQPDGPQPPQFHKFPVAATGPTFDAAFGGRLAAVFFDAKSYDFPSAKGCMFDPGVGWRVWSGGRHVDLLICFGCDEWRMHVVDAAGKELRSVGEDFDRTRPALVRLAKETFPNDPQIQALAERKE